ncbi:MAG TPA: Holliday junction resolvase RuvX [Actinomycetota bacterium]|jgi:putative holliday junction resolvase|nr:Holliday junction resolvase RuvX [Actinomycetota bacterium]
MTGRVLALDVGARRLGVAVSDPTGTVASPLATLPRRTPDEDASALAALAAQHDAGTVVVGLPLTLDGREGPAAKSVRRYLAELATRLPRLDFRLADERLSTVAAERTLVGGGVRRRARRAVVDQVAASVFLQTWLDVARTREGKPE